MVFIAEVTHPGNIHVQVNTALVSLVMRTCPDMELYLFGEKKHLAAIQGNSNLPPIHLVPLKFPAAPRPLYWITKIGGECIRIWSVVRKAYRQKPAVLIWTSLFPVGHWFLQLLGPVFLRKQRQVIILHGELEYFNPGLKRATERILRLVLRGALNRSSALTRYVVFSDDIKTAIQPHGLRCYNRIFVLPHPYPYDYPATSAKQKQKGKGHPLVVGTLGFLQMRKNSHLFFQLAATLSEWIRSGAVAFHTAGKCAEEVRTYNRNGWVIMHQPDQLLSQGDLERIAANFDLAVFFHDDTAYRYSASGAIHEALRLGIPVLALRNSYFGWLVQKHGKIMLLFDDPEQISGFIREVIMGRHKGELEELRKNLYRFQQENTLLNQCTTLKTILTY
jgi:hypothetical protein